MEHRTETPHDLAAPHFSLQPSLEDVTALMHIVNKEDVEFDAIAAAMESRTLIAAVMVRTANSVGLGAVQQVRSLRHALALIGLQRIRQILLEMKSTASNNSSSNNRDRIAS